MSQLDNIWRKATWQRKMCANITLTLGKRASTPGLYHPWLPTKVMESVVPREPYAELTPTLYARP